MRHIVSLIAAIPIAVGILIFLAPEEKQNFDDFALGRDTVSVWSEYKGVRIHCQNIKDGQLCIKGVRNKAAILWLGNSQLHAVNQYQPGQKTASLILHEKFAPLGYYLVAFSPPNASLQEHLVIFEYLRAHISPKLLVIGVCFDDTREDGLRPLISIALKDKRVNENLSKSEVGRRIEKNNKVSTLGSGDTAGINETIQQSVEDKMSFWIGNHLFLWRLRPSIRGRLFIGLYQLRNFVFGISPTSKRKKIPSRYQMNMMALDEILRSAKNNGIKVLAYNIPIRNDIEVPYDTGEYEIFKLDLQHAVESAGGIYLNLENLIPAEQWGKKDSTSIGGKAEVDFMHFKAGGHRILSIELEKDIKNLLNQSD